MSNSLQPHGLQHTRPPCLSPIPRIHQNPCPLSRWTMPSNHLLLCHPLLLLPSIFPSIRVFSNESILCIRWPKYWSFSFSPSSEYSGLSPLGLTCWISLQSKGLSRVFFKTSVQSINSSVLNFLYGPTLTPYMTTGKTIALTRQTFVGNVSAF